MLFVLGPVLMLVAIGFGFLGLVAMQKNQLFLGLVSGVVGLGCLGAGWLAVMAAFRTSM
jgi:hypothetical protein